MAAKRLPSGGRIDRLRPLSFAFDGRPYNGYFGDTLASALLANGVSVVGRSFKRHRPRGILSAGIEEPHAIVTVGTGGRRDVNARATEVLLYDGLVATSQNCWPSPRFDLGVVADWLAPLLPAGFYHKTFMWPHFTWYERAIRSAAGLGRIENAPDPDRYAKRFHHCDVLVVGTGRAGLRAARDAARAGADVTLLEAEREMGGALLSERGELDGLSYEAWRASTLAELIGTRKVRLLPRTIALGCYDDNFVTAVEKLDERGVPAARIRQRLWKIRASRIVLATGATERPLIFANNDRPGVMLAGAARRYAGLHAVLPGEHIAVATNNDTAYRAALDLRGHGARIEAIVDTRAQPNGEWVERARQAGIPVLAGCTVTRVIGRGGVRGIEVGPIAGPSAAGKSNGARRIDCDLVAMSGGWNPNAQLFAQAGGTLRYDETRATFVPDRAPPGVECVGAAAGTFDPGAIEPAWLPSSKEATPGTSKGTVGIERRANRQFVDFMHDVTVADLALAVREGFVAAEHAKRYTATGMAIDQGKTSSVNALGVLGALAGRAPGEVGTTTFRPPLHTVTIGALAGPRVGELAQRYRRLPVAWHQANGGVMEDHSGWLRAACYPRDGESHAQAIQREARAARTQAALFDSSSLGKIEVVGLDAAEFLNRLYVNNVKTLAPGRLRYGMMLSDAGIIKDDGVFGCLAPNHYLVCTSSAGAREILFWMEEWRQCEWQDLDVRIVSQTAQWATLTVSGPRARDIVGALELGIDLAPKAFPHMHLRQTYWRGAPMRIRRASYTGEISYELDVGADRAEELWQTLLQVGGAHGATPLGMEALDLLRVEKGFLEVGVDTDGETCPLDVGWGEAIARKPEDFIGRRSLARPHVQRPDRLQLVGLMPEDANAEIPVGTHAVDERGDVLGHVTSSCLSPALSRSLAMGRLRAGTTLMGRTVLLDVDGRMQRARICDRAFFDPKGERLNA